MTSLESTGRSIYGLATRGPQKRKCQCTLHKGEYAEVPKTSAWRCEKKNGVSRDSDTSDCSIDLSVFASDDEKEEKVSRVDPPRSEDSDVDVFIDEMQSVLSDCDSSDDADIDESETD